MTDLIIQHNFDRLAAHLSDASKQVIEETDSAMHRGAQEFQREAKLNVSAGFTGILKNSIHARRVKPLHYEIGTGQDYAAAQEQGTKPGYWPNMHRSSDFFKWVASITGTSGEHAERMAYLFGRSVYHKGTQASEFMKQAFEQNQARIMARISRAAGAGLQV